MEELEEIERRLEGLVPRGFSESGLASVEAMFDKLAANEPPRRPAGWTWGLGAAAAVALAAGLGLTLRPAADPPAVTVAAPDAVAEVADGEEPELVSELEGVVAIEADDGMLTDADGSLHRAWHVRVVSEERFRDSESGQEVRVVAPRDELVLMPVSAF